MAVIKYFACYCTSYLMTLYLPLYVHLSMVGHPRFLTFYLCFFIFCFHPFFFNISPFLIIVCMQQTKQNHIKCHHKSLLFFVFNFFFVPSFYSLNSFTLLCLIERRLFPIIMFVIDHIIMGLRRC